MDNQTSEQAIAGLGKSFDVQTDTEGWQGQEITSKSTPLIDPGVGKAVVLRVFSFYKNPEFTAKGLSQQEIFNMHWKQISVLLWGDGLRPREDVQPKVVSEGQTYKIFITCEPRRVMADNVRNLQDYLKT